MSKSIINLIAVSPYYLSKTLNILLDNRTLFYYK